jgi:hypothetical protein
MAIAYVSVSGSGTYPGTPSAPTNLSAALSTAAAGDTVYIATGTYRAAFTLSVSGSAGSAINFIGDSTNAQNINGASGYLVRITNYVSDTTSPTDAPALTASARSYVNFNSIYFDAFTTTGVVALSAGTNITFTKCIFATTTTGHGVQHTMTGATGPALSLTQCIFVGNGVGYLWRQLGNFSVANMACYITDCLSIGGLWFVNGSGPSTFGTKYDNVYFYNNTVFQGSSNPAVQMQIVSPGASTMYFYNNFIVSTAAITNVVSTTLAENYNTFIGTRSNIAALSANDRTTTSAGFAFDYGLLTGTVSIPFFAPYLGSVNQGAGTLSGAPATDLYSRAWSVTTPDIGSATNFASTSITAYLPTERNASTITIAPGSTSQSIELYLGATGLTASTSGLSARYNRTRTASVSIPLVARTIAQAWTSGGFAEVDATNMPGVYRLDLPDAALAAGADDVTIVVRGASGTNGAVMTVKLSSGGLTEAQTASAVWGALSASYTSAGSMGARVLQTTVDNRPAEVGTSNHIHANIHAIVDNTSAATELRGALLHNGTDYISADLLTPVSAATSVHIGPYQLLADGLGADQPLDVNVGTATSIDVQVTDANGTGIDITGATTSAKVYNAGGTLVATYSGTATYADNGRLSFGLTTTVTNTSGTYTVTVTRTTGATDTQVFGPLKLYVRPV